MADRVTLKEHIPAFLAAAQKALNEGNYNDAEALARRVLEIEPSNIRALRGLAILFSDQRKYVEAQKFAIECCQIDSSVENLSLCAQISIARRDFDAGRGYLLQALDMNPKDIQSILRLADIYERSGYRSLATKYYESAFRLTGNVEIFQQYAKFKSQDEAIKLFNFLSEYRPSADASDQRKLVFEMEFVIRKELAERARRGLSELASSAEDLGFKFADSERRAFEVMCDEALGRHQSSSTVLLAKTNALIARGAYLEAEGYCEKLAEIVPGQIYDNIIFNTEFGDALIKTPHLEITQGLPYLRETQTSSFSSGQVILLSCDYKYFLRFARPLLSSANILSPGLQVQLHVVNVPTEGQEILAAFCDSLETLKIAIATEDGERPSREYYHAIRFVRLYQFLVRYGLPVWLLDVDALLNRSIYPLLDTIGEADIALMGHVGQWSPHNQFRAGIVGVRPTHRGLQFAKFAAGYIAHYNRQQNLRWGVDQMALFSAYTYLSRRESAPTIEFLDRYAMSSIAEDESVIWANGGMYKNERLVQLTGEEVDFDPAREKYAEALAKIGY